MARSLHLVSSRCLYTELQFVVVKTFSSYDNDHYISTYFCILLQHFRIYITFINSVCVFVLPAAGETVSATTATTPTSVTTSSSKSSIATSDTGCADVFTYSQ